MKKILLLLVVAFSLQQVKAQSFQKGSIVATINYGIDIYSVYQTYSAYNIPNSSSSKTSAAGSRNWNFEAEYGLLKWLGVGIHLKLDNYFTSKDTSTGYTPTAIGFEGGVLINAHLIRANHFDLVIGCNLGFSTLTYTADAFNDQIYGDGSWTDLHISPRFYFGRFGINLNFYDPVINYKSLTSNNSNWGLGETVLASWLGKGGGATIGIQYRFIN